MLQPPFEQVFQKDFYLKGKWSQEFFGNNNPITLELGCGKGEYTLGLARLFPERNFIGVDIKGARIWRGAKTATEEGLKNVAFLRTRIDFIRSFFAAGEVEEIWITFPDPQPRKAHKRLTSSRFLSYYQSLISARAAINLKTDSVALYSYTKDLVTCNKLSLEAAIEDIYQSDKAEDEVLSIRTFYEQGWLQEGLRSHYLRFIISPNEKLEEPAESNYD